MHITHDKGDIAEAAVVLDLTKRGFTVFKPLTQNTYADIVILKEHRIETIQIKFVSADNHVMKIPLRKQSSNTKEIRETYKYNQTPLDWIAAYCPDPECIVYLPRCEWLTNGVAINIRTTLPKNGQQKGVRMITDFNTI